MEKLQISDALNLHFAAELAGKKAKPYGLGGLRGLRGLQGSYHNSARHMQSSFLDHNHLNHECLGSALLQRRLLQAAWTVILA